MILPGLVGMLQRRLLVAMRVAALGGGLRPPSDRRRAPDGALLRASPQDCAGEAGARTEVHHSVASLWRCAWHSIVTATGSDVMWQGYVSTWMPSDVVSPP